MPVFRREGGGAPRSPRPKRERKAPPCLSECHKLGLDLATVGTFPAELDANWHPEVALDTSDLQPMSFAAGEKKTEFPAA